MARILLKVVNVFRSENLALFVATSIHSIRKSTKKKKLRNKMEPKMESVGNKCNRVKEHGITYPNDVIKKIIYNMYRL